MGRFTALLVAGFAGPAAHVLVGGPALFFWVITVVAAGCWLGGLAAAWAGWRRRLPEETHPADRCRRHAVGTVAAFGTLLTGAPIAGKEPGDGPDRHQQTVCPPEQRRQ